LLTDARATIKDLETRLGHERIARDEAIQRAEADRKAIEEVLQTARSELGTANIPRECAELRLRDAQATISNLTEKLHFAQRAAKKAEAESAPRTAREAPSGQVAGRREEPVLKTRKATVEQTIGKPVKMPREKPVKWWLGER
jgi:hypothetical protein